MLWAYGSGLWALGLRLWALGLRLSVADPWGGGGGGGGGAEGAYAPPNKPTQNMNLIIVEQFAMRACATKARIV